MHRRLGLLFDLRSAMHSALAETYMHLQMIVEVSLRPCLFPRPGDALAGDARHGEASQKSLSAFHRPQYKFRVLLPLRLTEARKTPGVWRDFFVGSLLSVENPIISGPKQALYWL